jgi:pullulanase/glycogen debranching enzyme
MRERIAQQHFQNFRSFTWRRNPSFIKDPLWYKDAVIYQVHVKSFFDSNNDGIGDFPG